MPKSVCVCCGNDATGLAIEEDYVIRGIRAIKQKLGMKPKNNKLVLCKQCYPKHAHATKNAEQKQVSYPVVILQDSTRHPSQWVERLGYEASRKNYESRQIMYVALGVIFAVLGVIIAPGIGTFLFSVAVILLLFLMSLLSYVPKVALSASR